MSDQQLPLGLNDWLAHGERGISSEAIASHLSGINFSGRWGLDAPRDPADFRRCLLLLRAVPEFRVRLPEMASVSSHWARLVQRWASIESAFNAEVPDWASVNAWGRAPRTYELMLACEDRVKPR